MADNETISPNENKLEVVAKLIIAHQRRLRYKQLKKDINVFIFLPVSERIRNFTIQRKCSGCGEVSEFDYGKKRCKACINKADNRKENFKSHYRPQKTG